MANPGISQDFLGGSWLDMSKSISRIAIAKNPVLKKLITPTSQSLHKSLGVS